MATTQHNVSLLFRFFSYDATPRMRMHSSAFFYADERNSDACKACPIGRYSSGDATSECVACIPGRHGNASRPRTSIEHCVTCQPGQYQNKAGHVSCSLCRAGRFSAGSSFCEYCGLGKFADDSGLESCKLCPGGRYAEAKRESCRQEEL